MDAQNSFLPFDGVQHVENVCLLEYWHEQLSINRKEKKGFHEICLSLKENHIVKDQDRKML